MAKKIILAGGSGLVGETVARALGHAGYEVVVLTREPGDYRPVAGKKMLSRAVRWDARTTRGEWTAELEGAEALVNFTGRSVNCVHRAENQRAILASRVEAVRVLGRAFEQCAHPPATWVQCSAVGYYGDRGLPPCDETAAAGGTFLADVCKQWETAFAEARPKEVRPIVLRLATVLSRGGGALPVLAKLARLGLGGSAGAGQQGMSWIHAEDVAAVCVGAIEASDWRGTFNVCAPEPVANKEFMQTLRAVVHRPWSPSAPAWAIKVAAPLLLHTDPSLVLGGQFCVPTALANVGFEFKYPQLKTALEHLLGEAGAGRR